MKWVCDWPEAKSQTFSLYQGETATFEPTFRVNGRTVTNATIEAVWYQTNGMGQAWWRLDNATFAPSNDVGAAAYRFFVEARSTDGGRNYRANGALRMLPSPGFEPTAIEPPVRTLDFANIEVANAPWLLPEATNDFGRILYDYLNDGGWDTFHDWLWGTLDVIKEDYPNRWFYGVNDKFFWTNTEFRIELDAPSQSEGFSITESGEPLLSAGQGEVSFRQGVGVHGGVRAYANLEDGNLWDLRGVDELVLPAVRWYIGWYDRWLDPLSIIQAPALEAATNALSTSISSQLSRASESATNYTDSAIGALSAEIAPAVTAYPRVYAFMTGSTNASFSVTNYQLTAEADAERTHFDPSDPDLDFSTVPSSLRLEDFSTGTNRVVVDTRDWTVWYYAQKIGGAIAEAVSTAVNTCRAWVNFTATGLENPVPDTLIVDVPNIWLMAGKTFEKHVAGSNACWVIRSKDTVMPISDNAQSAGGFLELTDAFGEPYIRFNKTESYFVDPQAAGITNTNGTWYIVYPTQTQPRGGANAVIEGSTTYPGKAVLKDEDDPDCPATITWTGGAGHWVMVAAPKLVGGVYPSKMFFGAVVEVQGQDYIEYLRPMSIPNLVVDGVKIAPQIPASHPVGTTVPWQVVQ